MTISMKMTRREALKWATIAGGSVLLPLGFQGVAFGGDPKSPAGKPYTLPFKRPPVLNPVRSDSTTDYYQITAQPGAQQIIPGKMTNISAYEGIYPGPLIRQKKDRQSVVRFINKLNVPISIHLHGMAALPQYDGWANDTITTDYYKDYIYPNNRPATLWYHDHTVHITARNAYSGLAGMYIIYDDHELSLNLPSGNYDVPLVLHDKIFNSQGQAVFDDGGQSSLFGDVITINGVAWPKMQVERRKYRFRLLNASISRSYKLRLSNGAQFIMIATDAGLRSSPVEVSDFNIGNAERYEFVLDFSKYSIGTKIELKNDSLPNNKDYANTSRVMIFEVVSNPSTPDTSVVPSTLSYVTPVADLLSQVTRVREFRFAKDRIAGDPVENWTINGRTWSQSDMEANPQQNQVEIWSLVNNSSGWHHPVHIHLADFQIIDRNGKPPFAYEQGWKDVFYLNEVSTVRVVGKFGPHSGRYMTHCHNLVHEDHDMMRGFQVGTDSTNPASIAPAKPYLSSTPPL
jgi:spore coat protein A, manganese oxidase